MGVKKGYKQTEVGLIPEDWEVVRVDDCGEVIMGQSPPSKSYNKTGVGYPLINGPTEFTAVYPIKIQWTTRPTKFCKKGDLLICVRGSSTGRTNYANDDYVIGRGVAALRAKNNNINSYLSYQVIKSVSDILAAATGSTFPSIDGTSLRNISIPLPLPSEQQTIAQALSDADELIEALDKLIAKKRAIKQATMQQLLTGATRLPGFDGEWEPISIGTHAILKARIGWQALTTNEYLENGVYFLVTGTDFIGGKIDWTKCYYVDEWRYNQDKNIQLKEGDVLLTKDGTIGKVGYIDDLPGPATLNSGVFVIRPLNDSFNPLFLYYLLTSKVFEDFLKKITAGSTITHLYQKDFVNFTFKAPSLKEQTAIAKILSDMDAEIDALIKRRDKTRRIKEGMMQELLTGRTRLVTPGRENRS